MTIVKMMKPAFSTWLAVFLLLAGGLVYPSETPAVESQQGSKSVPCDASKGKWPHQQTDLDPSPGILFGELENGLRYVLKENGKPEDRVSMHLNIQAGSYHEEENERGIAHFLEHMLFLGTENFAPGELVKYFQRIGMKFGPDVNASTGFYQTIYDIDLPEGDPDSISEALLVLRDYAAGGLIPEEKVNSERSVILAEKRTRDSPAYRTFKETLAFELPGTRVTKRLPIGTSEVINAADRELIKTFYDTWYRPENMVIVMVGDFDADTAETFIQKRFSDIETRAAEKPRPDFGDFEHRGVNSFYHHEAESGSTRVTIEVITRDDLPEDGALYRKNRLLEQMANQIVNHRIEALLDRPDAPFTSAGVSSGHSFMHVRAAEISARCAPEKWEDSLGELEKNLRKALAYGFTESEVDRVKSEFAAELERAARAAPTRESGSIARRFLHDINQKRVMILAEERLALLRPVVEGATGKMLHEAFRKAWLPDHRLVIVTGNAKVTKNEKQSPEEAILSVYHQSRQQDVEKPEEADAISFPYLEKPENTGAIQSRVDMEDIGVTRVLFENGATLFVKKTDFRADEVLASLRFGDGRRSEPPDNEGLGKIAQRVVNLGGLGAMDREQLRRALAGTNTSVSFSVEAGAFDFSGTSVTDETGLLLELLYAHMVDPGYRESAFTRAVRQFERQYESLAHSIEGGLTLKGRRFLAGGDSRFGLPDFEALRGNELKDIETWIETAKKTSPLEIAVTGDVDPEMVIERVAALFGALPAAGEPSTEKDTVEKDRHPVFPEGRRLEHAVPTRMKRALLMVSYPTTDMYDIETTRRLNTLAAVFSDRMRIRIRDELGATYSQGAYSSPSRAYKGYGLFNAYVIIDPDDPALIEGEIRKIAEDIKDDGITEDELERAVKPILANITSQVKTNAYWLNTVLKGAARHPAQLAWSRTIFMDYASITVSDINKMAAAYLDDAAAATLLFYPLETGKNGDTDKKNEEKP
ncbi:MAG: M16 family metallopeptidase [Thermodesulfobacteriota bacterium]